MFLNLCLLIYPVRKPLTSGKRKLVTSVPSTSAALSYREESRFFFHWGWDLLKNIFKEPSIDIIEKLLFLKSSDNISVPFLNFHLNLFFFIGSTALLGQNCSNDLPPLCLSKVLSFYSLNNFFMGCQSG